MSLFGRRLKSRHLKRTTAFDNIGIWIARFIPIALIIFFFWAQSHLILTNTYVLTAKDLPKSFIGYKIMHVGDIANSTNDVYSIADNEKPDIILITGGYTDDNGKSNNTVKTINKLCKVAPVYYILNADDNGNDVLAGTNAINITDKRIEVQSVFASADDLIKFNESHKNFSEETVAKLRDEDNMIKQQRESRNNSEAAGTLDSVTNKSNNEIENSIIEDINASIAAGDTIYIAGVGMYDEENGHLAARDKVFELIGNDSSKQTILLNGNIKNLDEISRHTNTDIILMSGTLGTNRLHESYTKGMYGNYNAQVFFTGGIGEREGYTRMINLPETQIIILSDGLITERNPLSEFIHKFIPDVGTIFDSDGGIKKTTHIYDSYGNDTNGNNNK